MGEHAEFLSKVVEFARWAIRGSCWEGLGLDGGDVQEKAVELGLIVPCGKDCKAFAAQGCECEEAGQGFAFSPGLEEATDA